MGIFKERNQLPGLKSVVDDPNCTLFTSGSGDYSFLVPPLSGMPPCQQTETPGHVHPLDTLGTSGILPPISSKEPPPESVENFLDPPPQKREIELKRWGEELQYRQKIKNQVSEQIRHINQREEYSETWLLSKASASLEACGKSFLVEKRGPGNYRYLNSFHCKKKYCPRCAGKRKDLLLAKYVEFFKGGHGREILDKFDLAIFTVTLRHNKQGIRSGWYFNELKTHFRNSLKYGAFKKYLKGGVYSTEVTYSEKNGFHIHRHSVVLIPKEFNFTDSAPVELREKIVEDLRAAWLKKTGDSFEIDLTPFNSKKDFIKNILEVFKYVAKPSRIKVLNAKGQEEEFSITDPRIVEELERNTREKFFNRFGILYKEKGLALNQREEDYLPEVEVISDLSTVFIAQGLYRSIATGRYCFKELWQLTERGREVFAVYAKQSERQRENILLNLTNENFRRCHGKKNKLSG